MSLWNLLAITAGSATFGSSVAAMLILRRSGASPSVVVGSLAAVVIAGLASYVLVVLRSRIRRVVPMDREDRTPTWLPLLYCGAFIWIFVAASIAHLATRTLLEAL